MKLVCPHCAKVIEISESLAGQTTQCTLCQGPLTVPFASAGTTPPKAVEPPSPATPAPLPPPPPAPVTPDPLGNTTAWTPPSASTVPPVPPAANQNTASVAGKATGFLKRILQKPLPEAFFNGFGLGILFVLFILFFFPWVGIYMGNITLAEQSGMGVAFGYASKTPETDLMVKSLSSAPLMILAFFACLAGFLLLMVQLVDRYVTSPVVQNYKPTIQKLASHQDTIVSILLIITTLAFIAYWLFFSFSLEQAAWSDKANDTMLMALKLKTEGIEKVTSADMVPMQWLQRHGWFKLGMLLSLIALLVSGCHWLSTRGYTTNWPKLVLLWPGDRITHENARSS
ncbi:MAG: hypothetical protein JNJ77_20610 [Planctomycetia bacterium]|nr:hypothetical protein [Planctomycetia bacterium]